MILDNLFPERENIFGISTFAIEQFLKKVSSESFDPDSLFRQRRW